MTTENFLVVLTENKVWKTALPTLNLWGMYVIILTILAGVFNFTVAAMFGVLGLLFAWLQNKEVKDAFREWWRDLPMFKFHLVFVIVEVGAVIIFASAKVFVLSGNLIQRNGKQK